MLPSPDNDIDDAGETPPPLTKGNSMTARNAAPAPAEILTPKALAAALGTDPKTCRRFLRSLTERDAQPGKGNRWAIDASMLPLLTERFAAYQARKATLLTAESLKSDTDA